MRGFARVRRAGLALAAVCAASALPAAAQVPPPSYASYSDRLPCVHRIGRCFDATIGGVPVEVIADQAEFDKLKGLLQTGLKVFQGHQQHAEHVATGVK